MKNITLLIIFTFAFSTLAFGANQYNLTIKVFSLYNQLPLEGIKITITIGKVSSEIGVTDANGEIIIKDIKKEHYSLKFEDTKGIHKMAKFYYSNSDKVDQIKETYLKLTKEEEVKFFKEIDELYKDSIDSVFDILEEKIDTSNTIMATPKGGIGQLYQSISGNLDYPHECLDKGIQGKVYIKFIVQKDGKITHVEVLKSIHPLLDEEAKRVVRYFTNWNPTTKNGEPVRSYMTIPINFQIH